MKFTLSWLKTHLQTDASLDDIVAALNSLGLEVEEVANPADALGDFVIAEVLEAGPHPNADKLKLCRVSTGDGTVHQVVCGAPNARTGLKGVFAAPGTYVPGTDLLLKPAKIRGVESRGMLCSERELMLSDAHEGIIDLPADAPVGTRYVDYRGLDDPVIEIAITPDRQDCLGVDGIARDLAARGLGRRRLLETEPVPADHDVQVPVRIELGAGCAHFLTRVIRGVRNGESPDWLKRRLESIGLRPISALVDVTNFLTFDRGRPLHVFDAGKLQGGLVVRAGEAGETLAALDERSYTLRGGECVIADDSGVISLGGVMGGASTGVTEQTVDVVVEAAWFDPVRTAETGRGLNILSDARYRFERGVDPASTLPGLDAASALILELCGGQAGPVVEAGAAPIEDRWVPLRDGRVAHLGGVDVPRARSAAILAALGFDLREEPDRLMARVPSWRRDVDGEADLVEEVLRIHGLDHVPATPLPHVPRAPKGTLSALQRRVRLVRRRLAEAGLNEAVTWSFMDKGEAARFGATPEALTLANPISADLDQMRPSTLGNLLAAAKRNLDRGQDRVALFEIGPNYRADGQSLVATGVRAGQTGPDHWRAKPRAVDCFDAKADALAALAAAGAPVANLQVQPGGPEGAEAVYHPGRSGTLRLGPKAVLAAFGEIHPRLAALYGLKAPAVGFELFFEAVPYPKAAGPARAAFAPSNLPAVERDFAFVVDADVAAQTLLKAVRGVDKQLIVEASVFDVYQGPGLEPGQKSLAVKLILQPWDKTLTDEEIDALSAKVVAAAQKATGGQLRGP